jgi:hypothetical protein
MEKQTKLDTLRHNIKGKSSSLRGAVDILRDCTSSEKREIVALMAEAARDLVRYVSELEKELDNGGASQ